MINGQLIGRFPPPRLDRRTAGHAFQTVAVVGAVSFVMIAGVTFQRNVTHLRVNEAVDCLPINHRAAADPSPNRKINNRWHVSCSTITYLAERSTIHVSIKNNGDIQGTLQWT